LEHALRVLNGLVEAGVVARYAIGGAVGAIFWSEPVDTTDLDVFVLLPRPAHPLAPLQDLYAHLADLGYQPEHEFIRIEGMPVQFLLAEDATGLTRDALEHAVKVPFSDDTPAWVLGPEHLAAIALQTGRSKDYLRVSQLLSQAQLDRPVLGELLERFGLAGRWEEFLRRFPEFRAS
jgi:hypothetical protein